MSDVVNLAVNEPIFTREQIVIPDYLASVLKDYTKAIIRENPSDVYAWSQTYFEEKAGSSESKGE